MIISIANQKGGVGKTTSAFNIAVGLAKVSKKVLVIDFDPQSNLTTYLNHETDGLDTITDLLLAATQNRDIDVLKAIRHNPEGIDYIPANIGLASAEVFLSTAFMREQILSKILRRDELKIYDYIIIDCLPSLGILLTNAFSASDKVLIPVQAEMFAFDGVDYLMGIFNMVKNGLNPDLEILGFLVTMYDNNNMAKAVDLALRTDYKDLVFTSKTRDYKEATKSTYERKSLVNTKNSRLGADYMEIVEEILTKVGDTNGI